MFENIVSNPKIEETAELRWTKAVSSHIVFVQILGTFSTFACKTINAGYNLHLYDAQIPQLEDCTRF